MSDKLVLIDGHSILNRAFFGIRDLTNSEGIHTNAIYGFLNIMFKILDEEKPQYLTVAFDVSAPTFRHKMYADYKGTRKPMAQELKEQVPLIKELLQAMNIKLVEKAGYEADDLLGTIAKVGERQGLEVAVLSGDRDLLQLASDHIRIRIPKTKKTGNVIEDYYAAQVRETYQVTPEEFIDVKALMGDSSDNVPGVPGIGEKTATRMIARYHSIENAYDHIDEMPKTKVRESFRDNYEQAQFSKKLVTIDTKADIDFDLQDARLGDFHTPAAYQLCKRLEFKNFLSRFEHAEEMTESPLTETFTRLTDFAGQEELINRCKEAERLGLQLVEEAGRIYGLALALSEKETYFLPAEGFFTGDYLLGQLKSLLLSPGQKAVFDLKHLLAFIELEAREDIFDVTVAAYLINPLKNEYPYEDVAKDSFGVLLPSREDLLGKLDYAKAAQEEPDKWLHCICYEAYTAYRSWPLLEQKLDRLGMKKLFMEVEMPLVYTLSDMEKAGIYVDAEALHEYGDHLKGRILELEGEIHRDAGEDFNILSPKQLGNVLFEKLKLPYGKKTKTGYSTAADVLEKLAEDHEIVAKVLEYRQLTKLKSTYADGLANFIGEDGRIHTSFNQTITATGRLSSTDPNLQNIPIRMELGRLIRKVFLPKEGFIFLDADYSQIELRVLAHMSGDQGLIAAYHTAQDIHSITASQVFHVPIEEVTPQLRRNAKAVNFGIVYGISSFGLSQGLSITRKEAQQYIEQYFATYPGVKKFLDQLVAGAKETGYAASMYGRLRPLPELKSSNFMQRSFGERVAMNAPIQGTAADIIKIAMNRVHDRLQKEGLKSRLLLQVHDELLVETALEEQDQVEKILQEEMVHAADLSVPLEIDMHAGQNWYQAK